MRLQPTWALVALLVVVLTAGGVAVPTAVAAEAPPAQATVGCDADTTTEVVGCWNGTAYDETFAFNQSDGLNQTELQLVADRAMARVEHIRDRPFLEDVPVNLITREEYQEQFQDDDEIDPKSEFNQWNDQVWKALFIVGEDESSAEAIDAVFGGAVAGFYSPADDEITLVTDGTAETTQIDETTLVHEFGHAMQDQYHDLADDRFVGDTQDADLAIDGIVEGEVVFIEDQFENRCTEDWDCLEDPPSDGGSAGEDLNFGILQLVLQPYFDGPVYAESLFEDGGWEAVEALMEDPPQTTREIIHREPFTPTPLDVDDTATGGWERFEEQGVGGADTVGEASIYIMLWYQAFAFEAPTMSVENHLDAPEPYYDRFNYDTAYNYAYSASDGWANDKLYPHRNTETGENGYVWVTEWETEADARQFESAHTQILATHGEVTTPVTVIDEGPFRGAYGVLREGTTVTIVHGPDEESIEELRPGITAAIEEAAAADDPADDTQDDADPADE